MPWQDVLAVVNARLPGSRRWTLQRLVRAAKAYVAEGLLPEAVLERAPGRRKDDRLPVLVAAMRAARPDVTLQRCATCLRRCASQRPADVRRGIRRLSRRSSNEPNDWGFRLRGSPQPLLAAAINSARAALRADDCEGKAIRAGARRRDQHRAQPANRLSSADGPTGERRT